MNFSHIWLSLIITYISIEFAFCWNSSYITRTLARKNKCKGKWCKQSSQGIENRPMQRKDLFEGDIVIPKGSPLEVLKNPELLDVLGEEIHLGLVLLGATKWDKGVVPYTIKSGDYTKNETDIINQGMKLISDATKVRGRNCITFVKRTNQKDYILIKKDDGCFSMIGRTGRGEQILSLGNGCLVPLIVSHELMHALGFFHEQSRPDRDDFIEIEFSNIPRDLYSQFRVYATGTSTLDFPYNYFSIMHYEWNAFAIDPKKPTIIPTNPGIQLLPLWERPQRMNPMDVERIQRHYQCR